MQVTIREAKLADLDVLYRIEMECFNREAFTMSQLACFLSAPRFVNLLAEVDHEVAGFIVGSVEYGEDEVCGHVCSLDVSRRFRRRGIASSLLGELEDAFRRYGAKVCYLEVRTDNATALKLYERQGYVMVETLEDYYRVGVNGFRLRKELPP